ncbi:hypothetical protein [Micromonospora sp. SL4-19]|uniref:DUF7144 family membrane protein n=1 Tax=Micromonospora sp. SL4-19 TaxID=3399129 RepID=UPI003A4DCD11
MTQPDEAQLPGRQRMLAGVLLAGAGLFDAISGVTDLSNDQYVVFTPEGIYHVDVVDVTGWMWAHMATGALMVLGGILLVSGRRWSIRFAAAVAVGGIGLHLILLPFHPVWAVLVIGLAVATLVLLVRCRRGTPRGEVNPTGRPFR